MNNHEWNPITTAPAGEPILVTDGESVWFGRISAAAAVFDGVSLQDGSSLWMDLDDLTGWLPAPKTMWEPQKTADEMFRELGYTKNIEGEYANAAEDMTISRDEKFVWFRHEAYGEMPVRPSEILACAQLIREMEAKENG